MRKFIERAKVVLKAFPTYAVAASAVLVIVSDELATVLPASWAERVAAIVVKVVAVLSAAASIVRRVSPVPAEARGLLP